MNVELLVMNPARGTLPWRISQNLHQNLRLWARRGQTASEKKGESIMRGIRKLSKPYILLASQALQSKQVNGHKCSSRVSKKLSFTGIAALSFLKHFFKVWLRNGMCLLALKTKQNKKRGGEKTERHVGLA